MKIVKIGAIALIVVSAVVFANIAIWADSENHRISHVLATRVINKEISPLQAGFIALDEGRMVGLQVMAYASPVIVFIIISPIVLPMMQERLDRAIAKKEDKK